MSMPPLYSILVRIFGFQQLSVSNFFWDTLYIMVFWSTTPARGVKILDGITLIQLLSAKKSRNFGFPMGRLVLVEHYVGKIIVFLFSHSFLFLYPIVFLSCDFLVFFLPMCWCGLR